MRKAIGFLLSALWKSPAAWWTVPIVFGLGVDAMYGGDFILARVFYSLSLLWLIAKILDWKDLKQHESRGAATALVVVIGTVLFASSLYWTHYRVQLVELENQQIATVSQEPPLTATGVATLTILPAPVKDPVSDRVRLILVFIAILWYVVVAFWPTRNGKHHRS